MTSLGKVLQQTSTQTVYIPFTELDTNFFTIYTGWQEAHLGESFRRIMIMQLGLTFNSAEFLNTFPSYCSNYETTYGRAWGK